MRVETRATVGGIGSRLRHLSQRGAYLTVALLLVGVLNLFLFAGLLFLLLNRRPASRRTSTSSAGVFDASEYFPAAQDFDTEAPSLGLHHPAEDDVERNLAAKAALRSKERFNPYGK